MADEAASKAARRAESRGYADSAYRDANKSSANWGETESQRRNRLEKAGMNPDYDGWKDNPDYRKDIEKADKQAEHNGWGDYKDAKAERDRKAAEAKAAADAAAREAAMQNSPDIGAPDTSVPTINTSSNTSSGVWRTIDGRKIQIA
jgi:hypothetical protein